MHLVTDGDEAAPRDEVAVDVGAHVHSAAKGVEIGGDTAALDDGLAYFGSFRRGCGKHGRAEGEEAEGNGAGGPAPRGHPACVVSRAP